MADTKISGLPAASSVTGSEAIPVAISGTNKKITPTQIITKHTTDTTHLQLGTTADTACAGNDSRLSDARTPASHNNTYHSETYITAAGVTYEALNGNSDVGTGASQVAQGSHLHLEQTVTPDVVEFQLTPTIPTSIGSTFWDSEFGTLATVTSANTTLQHGQEVVMLCKNTGTDTILNGKAVRVVSGTGKMPTISLASAQTEDASYLLGVATQDIAGNNGQGYITLIGLVNGLNTDAWVEGTSLFLSTTAGELTSTKPAAPYHGNYIGVVTYKHLNQGAVYIRPNLGSELDELHDVAAGVAGGDILVRNANNTLWEPKTLAEAGIQPAGTYLTSSNIDDTAYNSTSWNGVTANTASKNALRDQFVVIDTELEGKNIKHGWNVSPPVSTELSMSGNIFSLAPTGGTGEYYYNGVEVIFTGTKTIDLTSGLVANTMHYIYFDDTSATLKDGTTVWDLYSVVTVATAFYNGSTWAITEERHYARRNIPWHMWAHQTIGCRYYTGFDITAPSVALPTTVNISSGTLYDEDIKKITAQATSVRHWYKTNATTWTFVDPATTAYETTNKYTNASWQQVDVSTAKYINMWVYGTLDINKPIYVIREIVAQDYSTIALARAVTPPNLNLSPYEFSGNADIKILYRIIWKGDETVAEVTDYRQSSPIAGGGTGSTSAAAVTYAPTSPETYLTVQGALDNRPNYNTLGALSTGLLKVTTSTGALSTATAGTDYIAPGAITGSGLTISTDKRLLGRDNSTSGAQAIEEISLGTGLALTSDTLKTTGLPVTIKAGSFNLLGATTEPLLAGIAGSNSPAIVMQFLNTADLKAPFTVDGARTANYAGGNINIKIDGYFSGTVTTGQVLKFQAALKGVANTEAYDVAVPTSSDGWSSGTYTITANDATGRKFSVLVTITAHASIAAGEEWKGYLYRGGATDSGDGASADAYVTGITVYE